jgi:hypothetical protein
MSSGSIPRQRPAYVKRDIHSTTSALWTAPLICLGLSACGSDEPMDVAQDELQLSGDGNTAPPSASQEPLESNGEASAGGARCVETFEYGCDDGECTDSYQTNCAGPKRLGTARQALTVSGCRAGRSQIGLQSASVTLLIASDAVIFGSAERAMERFTEQMSVFSRFSLAARFAVARPFLDDLADIHVAAFDRSQEFRPGSPRTIGLASCFSVPLADGNFSRQDCTINVYPGALGVIAAETGASAAELELVTALHEIGHVACLDHYTTDPAGRADDLISAMNSFHGSDASRPQLDYNRYTDEELRDVMRSGLGLEPPELN